MTVHTHPHQLPGALTESRLNGSQHSTSRFGNAGARSQRITAQTNARSPYVEPAPYWTSADVWQALHGFAVARLSDGRNEARSYRYANAHFWTDHLGGRGFSTDAVVRHQVGMIPSLAEARDHLRSLGFSDYDLDQSGFTTTLAAAVGDGRDVLCVPAAGLPGQSDGLAFLPRGEHVTSWQTLFNGNVATDASHLAYDHVVLTCDPIEALLLNDAGITEAYAVPTSRAGQVAFFESLAECGIDRVTFVCTAASGEWDALRGAAQAACDADCTPAVDLYELPHAVGHSVAFYVTQVGAATFRAELTRRHEQTVTRDVPRPLPARPTFDAVTYWAAVRPQLAAISDRQQRRAHERLASDVAELLATAHLVDAAHTIDAAVNGTEATFLPRSTSHHVEYVRSASARDAIAKRLFDLLRTTNSHVTVVTPQSHDEFLTTMAHHAAVSTSHGRSESVLRSELQTFGHRIQVICTPQPFAFTESSSHLIRQTGDHLGRCDR